MALAMVGNKVKQEAVEKGLKPFNLEGWVHGKLFNVTRNYTI